MTFESNYVIAIATLSDWLKRLAPGFQPMRSKTKTNRTMYTSFFPKGTDETEFACVSFDYTCVAGENQALIEKLSRPLKVLKLPTKLLSYFS